MKTIALIAAACALCSPARAEDQLNIQQCMEVLAGLNSLGFVGQLSAAQEVPKDAKHYKLGPVLVTIGMNIHELSPIDAEARKAQIAYEAELPPNVTDAMKRKLMQDNWDKIISQPCPVKPGHININDLKIGDGNDQNAIPASVLAVLTPILDGLPGK